MRENRKSGLMRGSNGIGDSRPLLSTLLFSVVPKSFGSGRRPGCVHLCQKMALSSQPSAYQLI